MLCICMYAVPSVVGAPLAVVNEGMNVAVLYSTLSFWRGGP